MLALIVYQRPNLLLLDEPTNHLDLDMREAIVMALQEFEGAIVIVSHDRHLLSSCTDEFYLVAHGRVAPFDGDLTDYYQWLQQDARKAASAAAVQVPASSNAPAHSSSPRAPAHPLRPCAMPGAAPCSHVALRRPSRGDE